MRVATRRLDVPTIAPRTIDVPAAPATADLHWSFDPALNLTTSGSAANARDAPNASV